MISIKKCYFTLYKRSVINEKFYKDDIFQNVNQEASVLLKKGVGHLTNTELYSLNKHLLKSLLGDAVEEVSKWGNADGTDILKEMKEAGIEKAWIGLPNWEQGFMQPNFVTEAKEMGYLVGPYDSYHSIHEKSDKIGTQHPLMTHHYTKRLL